MESKTVLKIVLFFYYDIYYKHKDPYREKIFILLIKSLQMQLSRVGLIFLYRLCVRVQNRNLHLSWRFEW